MLHEFRMPDAGEGLTEAEVLGWRVAVGDAVVVNQILLEVETAKAAVELPSPYAGVVVELLAAPGDVVPVGQPIIRIEDGVAGAAARRRAATRRRGRCRRPPAGPAGRSRGSSAAAGAGCGRPRARPPGQGAHAHGRARRATGSRRSRRPLRRPRRTPHGADHVEPGPPGEQGRPVRQGGLELGRALETRLGSEQVRAKPPVRRLARDLDVDLTQVVPTGPDGSITHDDVSRAAAAARGVGAPGRVAPTAPVGACRRRRRERGRAADARRSDDGPRDDVVGLHRRARHRVGRRRRHRDDRPDPGRARPGGHGRPVHHAADVRRAGARARRAGPSDRERQPRRGRREPARAPQRPPRDRRGLPPRADRPADPRRPGPRPARHGRCPGPPDRDRPGGAIPARGPARLDHHDHQRRRVRRGRRARRS